MGADHDPLYPLGEQREVCLDQRELGALHVDVQQIELRVAEDLRERMPLHPQVLDALSSVVAVGLRFADRRAHVRDRHVREPDLAARRRDRSVDEAAGDSVQRRDLTRLGPQVIAREVRFQQLEASRERLDADQLDLADPLAAGHHAPETDPGPPAGTELGDGVARARPLDGVRDRHVFRCLGVIAVVRDRQREALDVELADEGHAAEERRLAEAVDHPIGLHLGGTHDHGRQQRLVPRGVAGIDLICAPGTARGRRPDEHATRARHDLLNRRPHRPPRRSRPVPGV